MALHYTALMAPTLRGTYVGIIGYRAFSTRLTLAPSVSKTRYPINPIRSVGLHSMMATQCQATQRGATQCQDTQCEATQYDGYTVSGYTVSGYTVCSG